MKHCLILFILAIFCRCAAHAQLSAYAGRKEKVYVQTSHVYYKPGETMFFKAYVVKGENLRPSGISGILNVDIIAPAGNVVQQLKLPVKDGYVEGSYDFATAAPGGVYRLRAYTAWMQNEKESRWFTKEITLHRAVAPRVLMQLEFPGKGYGPGSEVAAEFSMRNLEGRPVALYPCEYTMSLNGKSAAANVFSTDKDGKATIRFRLPETLETSNGLLNVTVKYDAYVESISRAIPIVLNKIDLQFLPEGGTLVEGLPANMAFKAVNEFGKAADVQGIVMDDKGNTVARFSSYHFGMGSFSFTPESGRRYEAHITSPKGISRRYVLPVAAEQGLVMHFNRKSEGLVLGLRSTNRQRVRIAGFSRERLLFEKITDLDAGNTEVAVDTSRFPAGIARFTVLDMAGLPLAERVVFLQANKTLRISLTPDKPTYLPREKVTLKIKTENAAKQAVPSNLSLAVVDDKLWTFADDKQHHILAWLLMNSELSGKVEEPNFYFKENEPKALPALDLVMLTHGYRYYEYTQQTENDDRLHFLPEQTNALNGVLLDTANKPVAGRIYLLNARNSGRNDKVAFMETKEDGQFYFSGLRPAEQYYVIARSRKKGERVHVSVTSKGFGSVMLPAPREKAALFMSDTLASAEDGFINMAAVRSEEKQLAGLLNDLDKGTKNLEEVVVIAMGMARKVSSTGTAVAVISGMELSAQQDIATLLSGRLTGVQAAEPTSAIAGGRVMIRGQSTLAGNNQPLVVIDGVPASMNSLRIDPNDILNITVLKDAAATAIYGCMAANGVILIQSRRWQKSIRLKLYKPGDYMAQMVWQDKPVFVVAKKFYSPVYASVKTAVRDDFRETLYWNPVIQTNRDGEAVVSFYNSDATTTFRAIAEGIGYTGEPGRTETTYSAQQPLVIDAKMPPAISVGDHVLMPLNLKNNGTGVAYLKILVTAPVAVQVGVGEAGRGYMQNHYELDVTLNPGSAKQINIPVEALKACKETLLIRASGDGMEEALEVPVEAAPKGFPIREVFSGSRPATHRFPISKPIPGSLQYNLRLFSGLENQLLDGITSLLREPHGCFEQTSATTWPNVLILRLLRKSGKSNPAVEKQAMDYIQQGYARLISFETKQDGFEWFGHTPPHTGLTAMGLMEFTDMQEFVNVDRAMIERTKKWLLSRRDGKGGFKMNDHGMGQFYGFSAAVTNCYVVYAFTQAGMGAEIMREYKYAFKQAVDNKDPYLLGLMALAADNLELEADFRVLMNMLEDETLPAQTSMVKSRGASLEVEVAALRVLAMTREKEPDIDKMSRLLEKIMKMKSYYGYGSTQGTVLALQAMTAYASRVGEMAAATDAHFTLNGEEMKPGVFAPAKTDDQPQTFTASYTNGKGGLYYSIEMAYQTFYPPNSPEAELELGTELLRHEVKTGETVRLNISLKNKRNTPQPMAVAKIGIPAGLSLQPWQLKQLSEENSLAYYELFDNYLVLYWRAFEPGETKNIALDLKADIPGKYQGKASVAYLYYMPEHKHWNEGLKATIE
ncbi:TonB-dependent receptor plug domain-containing protein [Chitinophaga sp. GCM10012297]|uniref:TonB-dependent receptor plug domain-containing protein n=1 Tax=Chitinophaga chungangae TaxID=2821488 RepID=A0ABS3YHZ0_9BACT|nr:TonB-dependent receptor plug domain-containing protein [Chitinophaga chungangae]MBO9154307.1 TonB-dependent receptor plug domain-containing protein [Chitinophaga chungangae]